MESNGKLYLNAGSSLILKTAPAVTSSQLHTGTGKKVINTKKKYNSPRKFISPPFVALS